MSVKNLNNIAQSKSFRLFAFSNITTLFRMLLAFLNGNHAAISKATIAKIIFGLLYVVFFIDLVPDFIPIAGWLDDVAVVALIINSLQGDIERFRNGQATE